MREIPKYVPKWLLLCSVMLTLVTLAHGLALNIEESVDSYDIDMEFGDKGRQDDQNETEWDISGIADTLGALILGLDLPFPFPLIIIAFNGIMITVIAFCVSEIIKAWIPLV